MKNIETNHRIIERAGFLFIKFGIKGISMDGISKELGISKKTLYREFRSKDILVNNVVQSILDIHQQKCDSAREVTDNAIHEAFLILESFRSIFEIINPLMMKDMYHFYPNAFELFRQYQEGTMLEKIRMGITRGIEEGLYLPNLDIEFYSRARLSTILLTLGSDVWKPLNMNVLDINRELLIHFLRGISTPKGMEQIEIYKNQVPHKEILNEKL